MNTGSKFFELVQYVQIHNSAYNKTFWFPGIEKTYRIYLQYTKIKVFKQKTGDKANKTEFFSLYGRSAKNYF